MVCDNVKYLQVKSFNGVEKSKVSFLLANPSASKNYAFKPNSLVQKVFSTERLLFL